MKTYDTIIIGGGISGLSAAYNVAIAGKNVVLIEKDKFVGGRAKSVKKKGFILENGALYIVFAGETLKKYFEVLEIPKSEITPVDKRIAFFYQDKLHKMNFNKYGKTLYSLLLSELVETQDKINPLSLLFLLKCKKAFRDIKESYLSFQKYNKISAKAFVSKFFSESTIENIFEPISETFLFANLNDVSAAIFMVLIGAFVDEENKLLYLENGIGTLADKFNIKIIENGGKVIRDEVVNIKKHNSRYIVVCKSGKIFSSKSVISAIPTVVLESIAPSLNNQIVHYKTKYIPIICDNIALTSPIDKLKEHHLTFFPGKNSPIVLMGESTKRHLNVAPKGSGLLYVLISPKFSKQLISKSNREIQNIIDYELSKTFPDYSKKILFHHINKWKNAFALSSIEYFNNVKVETNLKGLFLCGDHIYVVLDGVILSGELAAIKNIEYLKRKNLK